MSLTANDASATVAESSDARTIVIRIRREDRPGTGHRWEEFSIPHRPRMNVISCLQHIAANPVTRDGKQTATPVWDSGCLEEVCGACTMLINGRTRQACSALWTSLGRRESRSRLSR